MSFLLKCLLGLIIGIVLLIAFVSFAVWSLVKLASILLRFILYCFFAAPLWFLVILFIPGIIDDGALIIVLLVLAILRGVSGDGSGSSDSYVLNKKSGIIHRRFSDTADTIKDEHKKPLSYSEAEELVNRGGRYRYKK